jgi:hypothetical protein
VGHEEISLFYDTFIAPRQIIFHRNVDISVGSTVIRDLMLEILMAPGVALNVPMHLRYDLREFDGDWAIERLRAHWELPAMLVPMLRHGAKSLPPSLRLVRELIRNQGLDGSMGYLGALRRPGRRAKRTVASFLGAAVAGDQVNTRRALGRAAISSGQVNPMAVGEFVDHLSGGRWTKMIATGDTISVSVHAPSGRSVVLCEVPTAAGGITRVRYFA